MLRHYAPVAVGVAALVLVVVLVPSTLPSGNGSGAGGSGAGAPGTSSAGPSIPDAPGSRGVAVSGVHCGPGVRQIPWSKYAPICQPAFHGDNGGATAPGVTAKTITVTYREAITGPVAAAIGSIGASLVGSNAQTLAAMRAYISIFNRSFELYGRHVVLKPFLAHGDFITEESGGGQAQAQQDADTAKSLGAFADVSLLASTIPYAQALAQQHVITVGAPYVSTAFLEQNAPYVYMPGPDCNKLTTVSDTIIGRSLAHMPAVFAGSPALRHRQRVIGVVAPDNPIYNACDGNSAQLLAQRFGVHVATFIRYPFSIAGDAQDAANMVAQLKAKGVTTVFCGCDPETPIYMTKAANQQDYHPEWISLNIADPYNRLPDQAQWSHDIAGGQVLLAEGDQEAYRVLRMADPTGPVVASYASIYEPLLLLFDALQAAGPDLTPSTFEHGFWSLPPSLPGGMYGQWKFGPGTFDPSASFQVEWWDPHAISPADGKLGAYRPCNGGKEYADVGQPALPAGRQLQCFDRGGP